jgi:hypothetical protein
VSGGSSGRQSGGGSGAGARGPRGSYNCTRCGKPKKGHKCDQAPKPRNLDVRTVRWPASHPVSHSAVSQ